LLDLGPTWKISNFVDKHHTLTSNENVSHPLLTVGWKKMADVFEYAGADTVIRLAYYGNNIFRLISCRPLEDNLEIPVYHSRSFRYDHTWCFCVAMNVHSVHGPYLVIFFKNFGCYI
jgi:hypothetical protein